MLVMSFAGTNEDFRIWLQTRTSSVVDLAAYRRERKCRSKRAALRKSINPSIA